MPLHTISVLIAVTGALYLAMWTIARRWPGHGPWSGAGLGEDERKRTQPRCAQVLLARQVLLKVLRGRFGELPAWVVVRIENGDPEWCEELLVQAIVAGSLDEMGLNAEPDDSPSAADAYHS